jgi:hypothetical protein
MNSRDELFDVIFDGDGGRARGIDLGSPEAKFLVELKSDLKALKHDIPECQLTSEHLKSALLSQPQVARPNPWRWLALIPLGATVAVLALFYRSGTAGSTSSSPKANLLAMKTPDAAKPSVQSQADASPPRAIAREVVQSKSTQVMPDRTVAAAKRPRPQADVIRSRTTSMTTAALMRHEASKPSMGMASAELQPDSRDEKKESEPSEVKFDSAAKEKVVIVTDVHNPETGAAEAQEVSTPRDMVFGG